MTPATANLERVKLLPPESYGYISFWVNPIVAAEIRRMESELAALKIAHDLLLRGEYICCKCGLRKDSKPVGADF